MFMVLIQSQEGGGPGHQCGSSTGATGPGHEPQLARLLGPGCRAYPGEGNKHFFKWFSGNCCLKAPVVITKILLFLYSSKTSSTFISFAQCLGMKIFEKISFN